MTRAQSAAILLCAGSGKRMRGAVCDKILTPMAGLPILCHSVNAFLNSQTVAHFILVHRDTEQRAAIEQALSHCALKDATLHWTLGGQERQDSVWNALQVLPAEIKMVFIHDCARPLIQPESLIKLADATARNKAAVLAHRVTDTLKKTGPGPALDGHYLEDVPRAHLWAMETPQAFERVLITQAYQDVQQRKLAITDDTSAAAAAGHPVAIVENDFPNPKLTTPADLAYMEFLLRERPV